MNPYLDPEPRPELAAAFVFGIAATMISVWLLRKLASRRRRRVTVVYGGSLIRLRLDELELEKYRRQFEALAGGKRLAE